ncbi:PKD domain-containing protein [Dysgonomonas macrotermitis]|uniref:PKD domain-containing protein n=1 Tax=Dysgonomonas macrotermitis TaxID=1346286 RepID=A0A1M5K5N7_9BACT|nr:PKD domain-containing protein [Dysgonomonas macrotermitis]SHG48054.1 PKD domain-containing protein [Dysgonomonas macrotermitis]
MKKIILLALCMAVSLFIVAQKETSNWVFGYAAGLTWNTTRSVSLTGLLGTPNATLDGLPNSFTSAVYTYEGCFSLSDSNGNLLFYSDGTTVYNKNHAVMTNGDALTGGNSSAQSGIILPYPGRTNQYIAITAGATRANNLSYSVIYMGAQGGLGAVVSGQKNIPFRNAMGYTGESVTVARHSNGTDYWILAIGQQTTAPSYINAWLLTSTGVISTTPVVTTLPYAMSGNGSSGYLKISPDHRHFVWPTFLDQRFFYGDFDSSTGMFSNIKVITGLNDPYGVEFSPTQSCLYLTEVDGLTVFKFDELFSSADPSSVTRKKYAITNSSVTALQIGPDKRIYWVAMSQKYMRIIDNADDYDNMALYQTPATFLSGEGKGGLPSFATSWFAIDTAKPASLLCVGNDFKFSITIDMSGATANLPVSLSWDFGDGSTAVSQPVVSGTTVYQQSHTYSTTGQYTVSITPYKSDGTALAKTTLPATANVVECSFRTNRMIRHDMHNSATKATNR